MKPDLREDLKGFFYVLCCLGFAVGLVVGGLSIYDTMTTGVNDYSVVAPIAAIIFDWPIAICLCATALWVRGRRGWLLFGMAVVLALLPLISARVVEGRRHRLRTAESTRSP